MNEKRERALQGITDLQKEMFEASDAELNSKLTDAENIKLVATSITIAGLTVILTAIGTQEFTDHEAVKLAMYAPIITGSAVASLGLLMFAKARITAQEIFYETKQRGLIIVPGPHRSLETPQK